MNEVLDHVLIDAATIDTAQIIKSSQGDTGMAHTARRVQTSTSFAHVAAKLISKDSQLLTQKLITLGNA